MAEQRVVGAPCGIVKPAVLRLSTTDRCNLRCCYCMPAAGVAKIRHDDLLSLEHLSQVAAWMCREVGVDRIKLTGGEPFVRSGVEHLIRDLVAIDGVKEVSATTNGSLLGHLAPTLRSAGLARVNVSIDTLDPKRYSQLTRGGRVADAVGGIDRAVEVGLVPVKLNAVLMTSGWREDVPRLLDFAADRGLEIRFIELMRTGTESRWAEQEYLSAETVKAWLGGTLEDHPEGRTTSPARRNVLRWGGREVAVSWISPLSEPFCDGCNRLRLDPLGRLRRCLMDPAAFDLARLLETATADEVRLQLREFLDGKVAAPDMDSPLPMVSVGG